MSNGAEQFLGRQLVNMTQALQDLVTDNVEMLVALQNMKTAIDSTIPKFATVSDSIKHTTGSFGLIRVGETSMASITPHVLGKIRLKISSTSSSSYYIGVVVNGIDVTKILGNTTTVTTHDIQIQEGDTVKIKCHNGSTDFTVTKIQICYDLVAKPNITY